MISSEVGNHRGLEPGSPTRDRGLSLVELSRRRESRRITSVVGCGLWVVVGLGLGLGSSQDFNDPRTSTDTLALPTYRTNINLYPMLKTTRLIG